MRWGILVLVGFGVACTRGETPVAPVVAKAPVEVVDAGTPVKAPAPMPEPIDVVAVFPERAPLDLNKDESLISLLLADPVSAEAALASSKSPAGFAVELLAAFARTRGEKSFDVPAEPLLPLLDGGVSGDVTADTDAWVSEDEVPLKSKGKTLRTLPLETKVRVVAVGERTATVELAVAKRLIYGASGQRPEQRTDDVLRGEVSRTALRSSPLDVAALIDEARTQADDDAGQLRAIALWQRAHRIERTARTREGLLRAAFEAHRASSVVAASLARDFAPVKRVSLEWACGAEAPPPAQRLDKVPKALGAKQCVRAFDARRACQSDSASEKKKRAERRAFMDSVTTQGSWLHFTVDARTPRQLLLVSTPLALADPCNDFEELLFEAGNGRVRRLSFPIGTATMEVWVPVERGLGFEHAILSAASEQHAVEWLRSREPYRWTVGSNSELQVSLNVNATGFKVGNDVVAAAQVVPPERGCGCEPESPQ